MILRMKENESIMKTQNLSNWKLASILLTGIAFNPTAVADTGKQDVIAAVDKVTPFIEETAQKLWDLSEVSLKEVKSVEYLKAMASDHGPGYLRGPGPQLCGDQFRLLPERMQTWSRPVTGIPARCGEDVGRQVAFYTG